MIVGGTSAVAPLYAALCAVITSRLGKPVSNWKEILYGSTPPVVDIIGGDNGAYKCTNGFDLCTGLGTIDGEKLLEALAKSNNLTILDPTTPTQNPPTPIVPTSGTWWDNIWATIMGWFGQKPAKFAKKKIAYNIKFDL